MIHQNESIKRKYDRVMIRFSISMSTLMFIDDANVCQIVLSNIYVKNTIFEACFRQSAQGKMTACDVRQ